MSAHPQYPHSTNENILWMKIYFYAKSVNLQKRKDCVTMLKYSPSFLLDCLYNYICLYNYKVKRSKILVFLQNYIYMLLCVDIVVFYFGFVIYLNKLL